MDDGDADVDETFIWGTNLSVSRVQNRFDAFIRTFRLPEEPYAKYLQLLEEVRVGLDCLLVNGTVFEVAEIPYAV